MTEIGFLGSVIFVKSGSESSKKKLVGVEAIDKRERRRVRERTWALCWPARR